MKKICILFLLCGFLIGLVGCKKQNKTVEDKAKIVVEAFESGDMDRINQSIFGIGELSVDHSLSDTWGDGQNVQVGFLQYIFEDITIKVVKTTGSEMEYEIDAPDMTKFFEFLEENTSDITEDQLVQYLKDYIRVTGRRKEKVCVEYYIVDGETNVNYQNEAFINAITGGLLESYQKIYDEMLNEYMEGD